MSVWMYGTEQVPKGLEEDFLEQSYRKFERSAMGAGNWTLVF